MRFVLAFIVAALAFATANAASPFTSSASARNELLKLARDTNADPLSTSTATVYDRFAGLSFEEVKKHLGAIVDGSAPQLPRKIFDHSNLSIPESFDVAEAFPKCAAVVNNIRDQSACGSCWAMAVSEAASDRLCIATDGKVTKPLSSADMLSCCSSCGFGCEGGYPSAAWSWLKSTGIVSGANFEDFSQCLSYPFKKCGHHTDMEPSCSSLDYSTPACTKKCDAQATQVYSEDKLKFADAYSVYGEKDMQAELMEKGSLSVAFTVYASFLNYKGGVFAKNTGSVLGGHAIKLVGWGVDTESGLKYWKLANSWNESWGEQGFFRMLRGSDFSGIESQANGGTYRP